jgi:hypothetical protein
MLFSLWGFYFRLTVIVPRAKGNRVVHVSTCSYAVDIGSISLGPHQCRNGLVLRRLRESLVA